MKQEEEKEEEREEERREEGQPQYMHIRNSDTQISKLYIQVTLAMINFYVRLI